MNELYEDKYIYFLVSDENNKKIEIPQKFMLKTYEIGNIVWNKRPIRVELFIIFIPTDNSQELEINVKFELAPFILKIRNIQNKKTILFNQSIFEERNPKNIIKLNCFDIYEEFNIYFNYFQKQNDIDPLMASSIKTLSDGGENSTFSFFLTIYMKNQISNKLMEKILLNIKSKGDL